MCKFETDTNDAKFNAARKAAHHATIELSGRYSAGLGDRGTVRRRGAPSWVASYFDALARGTTEAVVGNEDLPAGVP